MRNLRKSLKGISPVLSVLMMIAVAVAASLVTYAWVMGYLSFTTSRVGKAIQIQSMGLDGTDLKVYVQNVGDSLVSLKNGECLYIDGVLQISSNPVPASLEKGDTATITVTGFTVNPGVSPGHAYVIRVTTTDGAFTEATKTLG